MSKNLNYNYYGIETTVWPSNGENVASMVKGNTWNYYFGEPPETFGKPFDDSVAIWRLMPNASFACPGYIYVKTGNTLQAEFKVNENENTVPFVMQATSTGDNYSTYPHYRIADNYTNNEKLVYSRLCYDINPQKFCLNVQAVLWDRTADTNNSNGGVIYRSLNTFGNTINNNNNYKVVTIRNFIYFGGQEAPRARDGQYLTTNLLDPNQLQQPCVPMAEPYAYRPLPDDANMRKRMRYMFSNVEHTDWTTDKVFNPFSQSGGGAWYSTLGAPTSQDNQYNIGVLRSWTRSQIQNGAAAIPDTGGRITGQWLNCNFERKDFDDVSYHWRSYVWDAEHKVEVSNGLPLTSIGSSSYLRLVTELVIDDRKGLTLGEATKRAVAHEVAYIGFYFAGESSYAANAVLGDQGTGEGIYLPKRVNGVPNGEYYTGEDLVNSDEAKQTSTDDWYNSGDINPITGDEGDWSTIEHLRIGPGGNGALYWVLNDEKFENFVDFINKSIIPLQKPNPNDYPDTPEGHAQYEEDLDKYYQAIEAQKNQTAVQWGGADAWNYITCTKWYPMKPDDVLNPDHHTIHIAAVNTRIEAPFLYHKTKLWDMGEFYIEERYYNWRDYNCEITLFLPFIGSLSLDPKLYVGHTISVKYAIDWITADCTAYIYRDGTCMDSSSGKCGMDIPLTLAASGSYQSRIDQLAMAKRQENMNYANYMVGPSGVGRGIAIAGATFAATGGNLPAAMAAAAVDMISQTLKHTQTIENINYSINHTPLTFGTVSSASPINSFVQDWRVQLIITYPSIDYDRYVSEENYAHTQGYACCMQLPSLLNNEKFDCHGFTVVGAIDLTTIDCTITEAEMIRQALQTGVYINV